MNPLSIGNIHNPPFHGIDSKLANTYDSHTGNIATSDTSIPTGPHTLQAPGNNIASANGIYKGGKGKRRNKISKKYMRKSKRSKRKSLRRRRTLRKRRSLRRRHRGGSSFPISNTYSLGGPLSASSSALANPPPQYIVANTSYR